MSDCWKAIIDSEIYMGYLNLVIPVIFKSSSYLPLRVYLVCISIQVKSSQVKKFYWHKFIHFYNNHEVTETQLCLFDTTKYMTFIKRKGPLFDKTG